MRDAVAAVNAQVANLAPALNTQSVSNALSVTSSDQATPIDAMVKRYGGYTYIFAVAMRPSAAVGAFNLRGFAGTRSVEVLGEGRSVLSVDGRFTDAFSGYAVHIYRVANP
jgi:hypothetical protein